MSAFQKLKQQWLSLRLPWRKRILAGTDLTNNTYWLLFPRSPRPRRLVLPPNATRSPQHTHPSDYIGNNPTPGHIAMNIPPQWMQWLRHTRASPPSLDELIADVARQENLKVLVNRIEERWSGKTKVIESGGAVKEGIEQAKQSRNPRPSESGSSKRITVTQNDVFGDNQSSKAKLEQTESNPWDQLEHRKDEPDSWKPSTASRR